MDGISRTVINEVFRQIKAGNFTINTSVEFCRAANKYVLLMKPLFRQTSDILDEQNNIDYSPSIRPAGIYLLKVNNRNTRARCEICSKLTINTPERRHWRRSGVFIVNFEHISHLVLVFLLLTLNK